ncbi:flavocytochrome C [Novimethylophilus kurashikiensis]|uniref:Flavocytochrome C n=1 Tax=Novimethylophilus kurashikiensis TaxID=1825523 RepID=A0A2R5FJ53_9PROT|nr:NAD(P)/FAD-dependent oxidoreductase [Novimethylophilus kurashikiensis]GBG15834.1 flavocytochrome C [Novimethylophilus kurashikiensis]
MQRRDFLKLLAAGSALGLFPELAKAGEAQGRVVIVGGGYAGATTAKYLRLWGGSALEIILVEKNTTFVSCPMSNLVLGGSKRIGELTFNYSGLDAYGIKRLHEMVTGIDPERRKIMVESGDELTYDRLVLAPGVDFLWDKLPMLALPEAQERIPHAWKAGPQTVNLRKQLEAMPDGGVFAISIPLAPYRCPPGPYERASQVAYYLKQHKPKSKVLVLDANPEIVSKKGLFTKAWADLYPGMIEYRPNSAVTEVDVQRRIAKTEFEAVKADVLNVIPPQSAGGIAKSIGAANVNERWCEVDFLTYESKRVPNVHILGDSVSAALPKSAHIATSQAKVCASAIAALLSGQATDPQPVFANTCYSYVTDKLAMHVANVYRYDAVKQVMLPAEGGGVSDKPSEMEGNYAQWWAKNIWSDVLS